MMNPRLIEEPTEELEKENVKAVGRKEETQEQAPLLRSAEEERADQAMAWRSRAE